MGASYLAFAEHQGAVNPATLHSVFDMRGQVGDGGCPAWQAVQGFGEILYQPCRVDAERLDNAVQVGVLQLENLVHPMHQFHIWIAPQFAEYGGTFNTFVANPVKFSE